MYQKHHGGTTATGGFCKSTEWEILTTDDLSSITLAHISGDYYDADRDGETEYTETVQEVFESAGLAYLVAQDFGCDPRRIGEFINEVVRQIWTGELTDVTPPTDQTTEPLNRLINASRIAIALGDKDLADLLAVLIRQMGLPAMPAPALARPEFSVSDAVFTALWMDAIAASDFPGLCKAISQQPVDQRNRLMKVVQKGFLLMGKFPGWTEREYTLTDGSRKPEEEPAKAVMAYDVYAQEREIAIAANGGKWQWVRV